MQDKKPMTVPRFLMFTVLGVGILIGGGAAVVLVGKGLGMDPRDALRVAEGSVTVFFFGFALWSWSKRQRK